ncbi:MAG: biotin--[acetyl-CoA-carboxylase] ligase [Variibacter sp.]|nr:biotin--[acetyl-CoA-carboxylase] ligase [Variibacter sp.]
MRDEPAATVAGFRLIAHDTVGSTNTEALALARGGLREAAWVTARRQTAGRGRRGRSWESPAGNLYASLLLIDPCGPELAPQVSFVAALALRDALREAAPVLCARLAFKWPNDLLLDGRKVAGILIEGERLADGTFAIVVGIGVNCACHPERADFPATSLAQAGAEVAPDALLAALAPSVAARLAEWRRGDGFSAIRSQWLEDAWRMGETIRLRTPEEVEGRFAGIDGEGRLLLETADGGLRPIAAGDLSPPDRRRAEEGDA